MESPAAGALRSLHPAASALRRKPLQPVNTNINPPSALPGLQLKPKPILASPPIRIGSAPIKEDHPMLVPALPESEPRETSLGEELESIRRRREQLRSDRVRTEAALKERDSVLERWMQEMDRRWEEQRNLELELRLLIKLKDLRSDHLVSSSVQSLREKEQEKKKLEAQMEETICSEMNGLFAETSAIQEMEADKLLCLS